MIQYQIQKGNFIKHCPCSPETVPCGYYNLNLHTGCSFGCSYCILQAYLDTKDPIFYTNIQDMEAELAAFAPSHPRLRIGTGELSDSLVFEPATHYAPKILKIFERFPEVVFEFKTKSANVTHLLEYPTVLKNIVVSWSLNPQPIILREEPHTPDLETRLAALDVVQKKGYKIGIHFDPMLASDGWKDRYTELIRQIAAVVIPSQIAWWSLGTLRFPYSLREHILKHKDSELFAGELIKGFDGKYRYFKPLRLEMFRHARDMIRRLVSDSVPLYLCMEDPETWGEIFPEIEPVEETVNAYLYHSVFR